jgi:hypothetical protein
MAPVSSTSNQSLRTDGLVFSPRVDFLGRGLLNTLFPGAPVDIFDSLAVGVGVGGGGGLLLAYKYAIFCAVTMLIPAVKISFTSIIERSPLHDERVRL